MTIHTFRDLPHGGEDTCDVVVIGTGAAGGAIGKLLADAGLDLVFLEEGPPIDRARSGKNVAESSRHLLRDGGTQVAFGRSVIPVLQGRCVGGSTAINSAICWRIPDDAYDRAFARHGLADAVPLKDLHRHYDTIEADLSVRETQPEAMGRNNTLMKAGADRLGYHGHPTRRNEAGCQGSGRCIQTCPTQAKRSVDVTYIPHALARGARVYATCRGLGFISRGDRVVGVRARFWDPATGTQGGHMTLHARRAVVVAASVVQTPLLLSTLPLAGATHVGEHFKAHPGTGVGGWYPDPVMPWLGATQGYEVTHFREQGIKLESLCLGPELGSVRVAAVGAPFVDVLAEWDHLAVWAVAVRAEAEGRIRGTAGHAASIRFTPTVEDMAKLRAGIRILVDMHFAAGAKRVMAGIHGLPVWLGPDDRHLIDAASLDPHDYSMVATHLFGTARMAHDAAHGVVGHDFQAFGAPGLYVVDSSIFPSNIGVNPQHTIMAAAMIAGEKIANA